MLFRYLLANPLNRVEVEFLPVYKPNDEEKADPELYAKNVQKVMAEALGVQATDITYNQQYREYCERHNTLPSQSSSTSTQQASKKDD